MSFIYVYIVSIIDNVLLTLNHCFRTKRMSAKNLALGKQLVANLCVDPTVYTHVPQQLGQYVRVHTVLRSVCQSLCHNLGGPSNHSMSVFCLSRAYIICTPTETTTENKM